MLNTSNEYWGYVLDIAPEEGGCYLPKEMDFSKECEELLEGDYYFYEVEAPILKFTEEGYSVEEVLGIISDLQQEISQLEECYYPMCFFGYITKEMENALDYLYKVLAHMEDQL